MFNLIMVTNQNKLLTHFQKVLSHNFTLDKCYPQKRSGNLKVTSTLFLMSSLSCPKHSTLPQHTYLYVNPLNNLYPYPTAPSLFTSHIRQFSSKLKIIREWRIYGNNGQGKAICILHINKLFQSAPFWYFQFYWRPLAFSTSMFSFPFFLQFTWTSKVHFYWLRPSVCVLLLEKWRKNLEHPENIKLLQFLVNSEIGVSLNLTI